jgi:hypothetical protein
MHIEPSRILTPEQTLAVAIISQAISDVVGEDICSRSKQDRDSALGFIFNFGRWQSQPDDWSFNSLCERLGICPDSIKARLRRAAKAGEFKVLSYRLQRINSGHRVHHGRKLGRRKCK